MAVITGAGPNLLAALKSVVESGNEAHFVSQVEGANCPTAEVFADYALANGWVVDFGGRRYFWLPGDFYDIEVDGPPIRDVWNYRGTKLEDVKFLLTRHKDAIGSGVYVRYIQWEGMRIHLKPVKVGKTKMGRDIITLKMEKRGDQKQLLRMSDLLREMRDSSGDVVSDHEYDEVDPGPSGAQLKDVSGLRVDALYDTVADPIEAYENSTAARDRLVDRAASGQVTVGEKVAASIGDAGLQDNLVQATRARERAPFGWSTTPLVPSGRLPLNPNASNDQSLSADAGDPFSLSYLQQLADNVNKGVSSDGGSGSASVYHSSGLSVGDFWRDPSVYAPGPEPGSIAEGLRSLMSSISGLGQSPPGSRRAPTESSDVPLLDSDTEFESDDDAGVPVSERVRTLEDDLDRIVTKVRFDDGILRDMGYRSRGRDGATLFSGIVIKRLLVEQFVPSPLLDFSSRHSERRGWRIGHSVIQLLNHLFHHSVSAEEGISCCIQVLNDIERGCAGVWTYTQKNERLVYLPGDLTEVPLELRLWHRYVQRLVESASRFQVSSEHQAIMQELAVRYAGWNPGVLYTIPKSVIGMLSNWRLRDVIDIRYHYMHLFAAEGHYCDDAFTKGDIIFDKYEEWSPIGKITGLVAAIEFWELFITLFPQTGWNGIEDVAPVFPKVMPSSWVWVLARLL
ncbi:VP8 [Lishui pangolin virus]|nr:VP8 [Lishui pangolin virus]